jgi:hypothetical protein
MRKLLAAAVLPVLLFALAGCHPTPPPYPPPPPPGVLANQAYSDGVNAARQDLYRRLPPNVDRHGRFRNPPVPPGQPVRIYRNNFQRGYAWVYNGGR